MKLPFVEMSASWILLRVPTLVTVIRLKTTSGGVQRGTGRSTATGGARRAAARTIGRTRTERWSDTTARRRCFGSTLPSTLLANQQLGVDSPVRALVEGLQDRSTDG